MPPFGAPYGYGYGPPAEEFDPAVRRSRKILDAINALYPDEGPEQITLGREAEPVVPKWKQRGRQISSSFLAALNAYEEPPGGYRGPTAAGQTLEMIERTGHAEAAQAAARARSNAQIENLEARLNAEAQAAYRSSDRRALTSMLPTLLAAERDQGPQPPASVKEYQFIQDSSDFTPEEKAAARQALLGARGRPSSVEEFEYVLRSPEFSEEQKAAARASLAGVRAPGGESGYERESGVIRARREAGVPLGGRQVKTEGESYADTVARLMERNLLTEDEAITQADEIFRARSKALRSREDPAAAVAARPDVAPVLDRLEGMNLPGAVEIEAGAGRPPEVRPPAGMTLAGANPLGGAADPAKLQLALQGFKAVVAKDPSAFEDARRQFIERYGVDPVRQLLLGPQ